MPLTPEALARQTGWTLHSWQQTQVVTGPLWQQAARPIAEMAGMLGTPPDVIATELFRRDGPIAAFGISRLDAS